MNPYKVLGLRTNATQRSIEKRYRNLLRKLHPDCGGSAEAFNELQTAYEVLSDPVKRKHYDDTGELLTDKPNLHNSAALELLIAAFDAVLRNAVDQQVTKTFDLRGSLKATLNAQLSDLESQLESARAKLSGLTEIRSRLTQPDPLVSHVSARTNEVTDTIKRMQTEIDVLKLAIDMAENVEYRRDKTPTFTPIRAHQLPVTTWHFDLS